MKLSLCPQPFYHLDFDAALETIAALGVDAIELPVDGASPWIDLDQLQEGGAADLRRKLSSHGLEISALSNHHEGQLLLGPHHADTDGIHPGHATEKVRFATERLLQTAELAAALEVPRVVGFVGCEDYTRFFPWPARDAFEQMIPIFRERMLPILDHFDAHGVSFGQEPHPKQLIYNTETAIESVGWLDGHPRWGFNLDPANLLLAGVDPVVFVAELGVRILHVHAKDGELVAHNAARSGLLAHGPWGRPDRGFRFRTVGWGDVPWKRLVTELILSNYDGYLAIENEDPIFHPLDGVKKGIAELRRILPEGGRKERWW